MAKLASKFHTPNRYKHALPDSTRTAQAKQTDQIIRQARLARGRGVLPTVPAEEVA